MSLTTRTDIQVENAVGLVLYRFETAARAHAWIDEQDGRLGPLTVIQVTTTTTVMRRRVDARGRYAPRFTPQATGDNHHGR